MKVLLIDVNCKTSSTGKIVYDLYSYINSNGDEAAVCYGRGERIVEENIFKFGLDWETYLHALLTRITGYTGCFSFFSTRRLIRFIKKYNPDVIHIHELHAYFVNIKPLINYLKKNHIRTVMTLHCEFTYTGKCGHSVDCEQWKTACKKCPRLHEYVSTFWFDHTAYMFRQKKELFTGFEELIVTTPSKWLSNRVAQSFLKNSPSFLIRNGIDTTVFSPKDKNQLMGKYKLSNQKIILALAPNLTSKEKGGMFVIELAKRFVGQGVTFILVGVDEKINTIPENVILETRINDKNLLAQYYSLADAFVICSERENYPTTSLEAQACGTPVYGFDTGGTRETDIYNRGIFVDYSNIDQLEDATQKMLQVKTRSEYGSNEFSTERMCEEYAHLYINTGSV